MRILHAIHDFLPRHAAGSELYALGLARALEDRGHEVHVVCAEFDPSRAHGSLEWRAIDGVPVTEIVNNWRVERLEDAWESPEIGERLATILDVVRPDVLHVHNLLNLSLGLPELARRRGIPVLATLHDFTLFCASGGQRVHRSENHLCETIEPERCARCFSESPFHRQMAFARFGARTTGLPIAGRVADRIRRRWPGLFDRLGSGAARSPFGTSVTPKDMERRLDRVREVARSVDRFVAPSEALARDHVRFGLPSDRVEVSDYGFAPWPSVPSPPDPAEDRVRLGFVGTLAWHKGVHVLLAALRRLEEVPGWDLAVHGSLETFPDYSRRLEKAAAGLPVHFSGRFDRGDLPEVYEAIDVLVVPLIWPENSPLVIHEAFQAGRPVVGARTGGIPELLAGDPPGGWLAEPGDAEDLARVLRSLVAAPDRIRDAARRLPNVKSLAQDAEEWEVRYERSVATRGAADRPRRGSGR